MHPFLLPLATTLALTAAPAFAQTLPQTRAQGLSHAIEGRFGVAYSGNGGAEAIGDIRYTMTLSHQTDDGIGFALQLGFDLGNSGERWPRSDSTGKPLGRN